MTIEDRFKKAIQTRNDGNLKLAIDEFHDIIKDYPNDHKISGVYTVLAGVYKDLDMNMDAMIWFKKATILNPSSELASLGLYISYTKLGNYQEAINELKRYLSEYPADRYKLTLKELLNDLEVGYAVNFRDTIVKLARMHNVNLPNQ